MKVIFVLDDMTVVVSTPEELQLRQIDPEKGLAAITAPTGKKNEDGEDLFYNLISYPVYLSDKPFPAKKVKKVKGEAVPVVEATPEPAAAAE